MKKEGIILFSIGVVFTLIIGLAFSGYTMWLTGRHQAVIKQEQENTLTDILMTELLVSGLTSEVVTAVNGVEKPQPAQPQAQPAQKTFSNKKIGETLVDNEICTISLVRLYDSEIWGACIDFQIYNKTNESLMFSFDDDDVSINGQMCNSIAVETIAPNKTGTIDACFSKKDLQFAGVETVSDIYNITLSIHATNKNLDRVFDTGVINLNF